MFFMPNKWFNSRSPCLIADEMCWLAKTWTIKIDLFEQNKPFYHKLHQRCRLDHLIDSPGAEVMISPRGVKSIFQVEQVSTFHQQLDMDSCLGSAAKSFIRHEEWKQTRQSYWFTVHSSAVCRSDDRPPIPSARPDSYPNPKWAQWTMFLSIFWILI